MAVSDLLPRKAAGSRTRRQALNDHMKYDQKEEKTNGGEFVSSYMCCPETAADEFEQGKLIYESLTGRRQPAERDIIAYRIIQSFKPGEITPEEANKLGYELAMKFTKGQHQFVVSTHTDKAHIHNHIEFNSTNLECDGKFNNFKNSALSLRKLNDKICMEHGYSVIENPKSRGQRYGEKAAAKRGRSFKELLRQTIGKSLPGCKDFDEFLSRMRSEGYEVRRRGKSLEFRAPGQTRFTRSCRLGDSYTEASLKERIDGKQPQKTLDKKTRTTSGRNVNLLVDIQAKMQAGKGKGYERKPNFVRWAKVFNLKEAAKTLNFLVENGITDYDELSMRTDAAGKKFDTLSARIKQLEGRMADAAQLKMHIINYSKTRDTYKAYKKSRHKKEYYAEHTDDIKKHEAAKAAFDRLAAGGKPIPKVAQLTEEYAALLAEKKECYEEYKSARKEMLDYQTAKQNIDKILGLEQAQQEQKRQLENEH